MKMEPYLWLISLLYVLSSCSGFSGSELVGKYINVNYDYTPFLAEIPYVDDTLVLRDDFTFQSKYFGQGNYKINRSFVEAKIVLHCEYEMGDFSFEAMIESDETGKPKIVLFRERNHCYKKVE